MLNQLATNKSCSKSSPGIFACFYIIFSKFYQPGELLKHSTSKSRFKGSGAGLGLALSKGIVEAHGGRIWVDSTGYDEVNFPGSQFHVMLPLSNAAEGEETMVGAEVKVQLA